MRTGGNTIAFAEKILTCCYCGRRSAFVPDRRGGVSCLSCASCGAPLSAQKPRPLRPGTGQTRRPDSAHGLTVSAKVPKKLRKEKTKPSGKRPGKRKSRFRRLLEEVTDAIEDIFD